MQAMILAAGFGTRLRPYTLLRPKPLFPVLNRPLLLLTIERLRKAGFTSIIVNAHHLAEQIKTAVAGIPGVTLQEEEIELGTGGGLRRALPLLKDEPVLVVNGDIYHTVDYQHVFEEHSRSGADVTLVMHDCPRYNKVQVDSGQKIVSFSEDIIPGSLLLAFTGIHVINPRVLAAIPPDIFSNIIDRYRQLLQEKGNIRALKAADHYWTDIGTPADYLDLHEGILSGTIPCYEELQKPDSSFFVSGQAGLGSNVQLKEWVCIGNNVTVGDNASLSRVIIWENGRVPEHAAFADKIIGR
jgi:mannose-1-phosphate guanylyltransferase